MDIEELRSIICYEPVSGVVTRLSCHQRPDVLGESKSIDPTTGYQRIAIGGKKYYVHRLVWFYMTGAWPKDEMDHINGNRSDNRWVNLRSVSRGINAQNIRSLMKNNVSGHRGVSWDASRNKWSARIRIPKGPYKYLGRFDNKEDAIDAYVVARMEHHLGYVENVGT